MRVESSPLPNSPIIEVWLMYLDNRLMMLEMEEFEIENNLGTEQKMREYSLLKEMHDRK